MKESATYQAILREGEARGKAEGKAEGRVAEARRILLLLGCDQFGEPPATVQAALDALNDADRLEELTVRLRHVASWQQLLRPPDAPRRRARRKPSS